MFDVSLGRSGRVTAVEPRAVRGGDGSHAVFVYGSSALYPGDVLWSPDQ